MEAEQHNHIMWEWVHAWLAAALVDYDQTPSSPAGQKKGQ
jgi:hypothetical protein